MSTDNVGHLVLSGVASTGKTTVLRALSIGVAVLLTRMLPVTRAYDAPSRGRSPVDMLVAVLPAVASAAVGEAPAAGGGGTPAAGAVGAAVSTIVEEALGQLRAAAGTSDLDVCLVLVEFQPVFDEAEDWPTNLRRRIVAAADVAAISRLGRARWLSLLDLQQTSGRASSAAAPKAGWTHGEHLASQSSTARWTRCLPPPRCAQRMS